MKKQTAQSRMTARRKARQQRAYEAFKRSPAKLRNRQGLEIALKNYPPFDVLPERSKHFVIENFA